VRELGQVWCCFVCPPILLQDHRGFVTCSDVGASRLADSIVKKRAGFHIFGDQGSAWRLRSAFGGRAVAVVQTGAVLVAQFPGAKRALWPIPVRWTCRMGHPTMVASLGPCASGATAKTRARRVGGAVAARRSRSCVDLARLTLGEMS
jgi:hypothetical protein